MAKSLTSKVDELASGADSPNVSEAAKQSVTHDRVMDAYFGKMGEQFMRKTQERVHWVCGSVRGNNILDVGCSQGIVPILLGREGKNVVGLDTDEAAIKVAREYVQAGPDHVADHVEFIVGDFVNKGWGERHFDTVVMAEVLEHLVDPGAFVARAADLLVPGGCLVVTVPFGINEYIDHKWTYYLVDVYRLLSTRFDIEEVELFGRWIGFRAKLCDVARSELDKVAIPFELLRRAEKTFQQLERDLLETTKNQRTKLDALQARVKAIGGKLEVADQSRSAIQAELDASRVELSQRQLRQKELEDNTIQQQARIATLEREKEKEAAQQQARIATLERGKEKEIAQQQDLIAKLEREKEEDADQQQARIATLEREKEKEIAQQQDLIAKLEREKEEDADQQQGRIAKLEREKEKKAAQQQGRIAKLEREKEEDADRQQARIATLEREKEKEAAQQQDRIAKLEREKEEDADQQRVRIVTLKGEFEAEVSRHSGRIAELEREQEVVSARLNRAQEELAKSIAQLQRAREQLSQLEVKLLQAEGRAAMASPTAIRLQRMQRAYESEVTQQQVRTHAAEARLEFVRTTLSAQLGAILTYACRSPRHFVKTPVRLARLLRALFARDERGRLSHVFVPDLPDPVPGAARVPKGKMESIKEISRKAVEADGSSILTLGWPEPKLDGRPLTMAVMDEFTRGCFENDLSLLLPRPDNWRALAEEYPPELFFVESAWKGNDATWQYRVADYSTQPGNEVADMLFYAASRDIPAIFWNKEDPVHHQKFMGTAKKADYIFTTDANMIDSYKEKTGNSNVHALPFAAQPALHRPAPLAGRINDACFAGTWYGDRHQKRGEDMRWLLSVALPHGLTIFDRNYGTGNFEYPRDYRGSIKGGLPYKELCEEYRKYRLFLNVNSVTESPTMFSRRVFELMASGTPVVSAHARGIEEMFGHDTVWLVRNKDEADEAIHALMSDDKEWRRRSLLGIRKVFAGHTYGHRLNTIFEVVGAECRIPVQPKVLLLGRAATEAEFERLVDVVRCQTYESANLRVATDFREPGRVSVAGMDVEIVSSMTDGGAGRTFWLDDITKADAVGWLSCEDAYGPAYVRDLANAMLYRPEAAGWAKALDDDQFAFGQPARNSGAIWRPRAFASRMRQEPARANVAAEDLFVIDGAEYATDGRAIEVFG